MKRINQAIMLLSVLAAFVLTSCGGGKTASSDNVKYYRSLQFSETPYDLTKGIYPLTADEAKNINHYRFTYNDNGQLAEVAFMRGDHLLDYSSMGAARMEFTYTDSTQVVRLFDKAGKLKESASVAERIYRLDKEGKRIGLYFLDKDGNKTSNRNKIAWYNWKVLPDGMVQEKRYNMDGVEVVLNPFCPFYELRFSYDNNGFCTRMANYMDDTLYNCTAENCGDIGVSYFTFQYNPEGAIKEFSVFNVSGQHSNLYWGWSKFDHVIDDHGYVTQSSYFDQDGEYVGGKNIPITTFSYDDHGALVEEMYYDKDHKPLMNENEKAAMIKYVYDEQGNPKDTLRFDTSMQEIKM